MRIFLLILILTIQSFAETYYFSTSGSSGNDGLSSTYPKDMGSFDNILNNVAVRNDSLLIKRGDTWTPLNIAGRKGSIEVDENKTFSGSNGYVYIGAYGSGAMPKIDSRSQSTFTGVAFRTTGIDWLWVDSLEIYGHMLTYAYIYGRGLGTTPGYISGQGLENCKFTNLVIHYSTADGFSPGGGAIWQIYSNYFFGDTDMAGEDGEIAPVYTPVNVYNPIANILFEDITMYAGAGDDGFNIFSPTSDITFRRVYIYNPYEDGIDMPGGDDHLVEYCYILNPGANGIKFHSQANLVQRAIVRYNIILSETFGVYPETENALAMENTEYCEIYNNVLYANYSLWIGDMDRNGTEGYYGTCKGNVVRNNLMVGTFLINGLWNDVATGGFETENTYTNNSQYLVWDDKIVRWDVGDVKDLTTGNQSTYWDAWMNTPWSLTGVNENKYENWETLVDSSDWWTPQTGSSALMTGVFITGMESDFDGDLVYDSTPDSIDRGAQQVTNVTSVELPAEIAVNPTFYIFSQIDVSSTATKYFLVTNAGGDTVTVDSVKLSVGTDFSVNDTTFTTITETDSILVTYDPLATGTDYDTLYVYAQDSTVAIPIEGSAGSVTPAALSTTFTENIGTLTFGSELIPNNDYTNTANWSGDNPIGAVVTESGANEITEDSGARFISDGTWIELRYNSLCTSGLMYKYSDVITVTSGGIKLDAGNGAVPSDINMTTTGTHKGLFIADANNYSTARATGGCDVKVLSKSLKLVTSQYVDTASVTNTGDADLTGTAVLKNGTDYEIVSGSTIFNTTSIIVRYKPTAEGTHTDSIIIATNGGNDTLALSASWGVATDPNFYASISSYDFGSVYVDSTSTDSFYIYNAGTDTLNGVISVNGQFSCDSTTYSVDPGDTIYVPFSFTPLSDGVKTGSISITHDGTNITSPQTISLSGSGSYPLAPAELRLSDTSLNMGTVDTSATFTDFTTIYNDGDESLLGTASLDDSTDFQIVSGWSINTTTSHNIIIKFDPTSVGSKSANLILTTNDPDSPHMIPLSGVGGSPVLSVSASSVDFGSVRKDSTVYYNITVANTGTGTLNTTASLSGSSDYSIVSGSSLTDGGTIRISFTPSTALQAAIQSTLTISSNVGNATVSLIGYGYLARYRIQINKKTTASYIIIEAE